MKLFINYNRLRVLGIFTGLSLKNSLDNLYFNYYLSFYSFSFYSISLFKFFKSINRIYPFVIQLLVKKNIYLFLNIDKTQDNYLSKIFSSLFKHIITYFIYDWGFGLLTNINRMYLNSFFNENFFFYSIPTVVFFLRILNREHYFIVEIQRSNLISLGPISYNSSNPVDYPIPMSNSLDFSYFFLKIFILLVNKAIYTIKI